MTRRTGLIGGGLLLALVTGASPIGAAPVLRLQVDLEGDFALVGNTLGHECSNNPTTPVVGTVGNCGNTGLTDTAPDVFWRADEPAAGQAAANNTITPANARTTAVLGLPNGAVVRHAYLYWAAVSPTGDADTTVTLRGPSATDYAVTADDSVLGSNDAYQSLADVTTIVTTEGVGAYRLSDVEVIDLVNLSNNNTFAGWWLVVLYEVPGEPLRNIALFDGLDVVGQGAPQNITLSGFLVPDAGFDGKLGIVTFEGDRQYTGDQFSFDGNVLSGTYNPANNFFNGTRTWLDALVSTAGDLPQLTGEPGSMSGMDLDVLDVTAWLAAGQTSVDLSATSTQDVYHLAGFITSISTFKPDFSTSTKSVVDLDGGALLAGDTLEYTIVVTNTGNDTAIDTVLTDPLPVGVSYVPGSLEVTAGANVGAKTDAAGDDQGEYVSGSREVVVRLGTGADAVTGGTLAVDESTTIVFQVTVDAGVSGSIENQAIVSAAGLLGDPPKDTPTDGNGGDPGAPPTTVDVDECDDDGDCPNDEPLCDTVSNPNVCVECLVDDDCPGTLPTCDPASNTCVCVATGAEICDGDDNDCNGTVDEGFDVGTACSVGVGECETAGVTVCTGDSTTGCDAVAGQPTAELCNGLDDDCDGDIDNDCTGTDTDGDGLTDEQEADIGTDPNDADSDDDGVPDGQEPEVGGDSDGDGLIGGLDPDSDNDGLYDGTEMGLDCSNEDTDLDAGHCVPDADGGATTTDPLDSDSDDGGISDGSEDINLDGAIDSGETDPNDPSDDSGVEDTDGDGLSDDLEEQLGTDPNDWDSDDDGLSDGEEPNPADDTDGDGDINALDPDSDDDGIFDGTEMGKDCANEDTDPEAGFCVPDGDQGATTTSPLDPDTDHGGVPDGEEDTDHDGVIDPGETDPNDPVDDVGGGGGAGGTGGSGTGGTATGGSGTGATATGGSGTGNTGANDAAAGDVYVEGAGLCSCSLPGQSRGSALPIGLGLAGLGLLAARRGRRR